MQEGKGGVNVINWELQASCMCAVICSIIQLGILIRSAQSSFAFLIIFSNLNCLTSYDFSSKNAFKWISTKQAIVMVKLFCEKVLI